MEKEKLSSREAALVAQARREAEAQKSGNPPPAAAAEEKPKASPAGRLAQLMAEERAETARRKKKMRRYGLIGSAAILAAFALWLLRVFSRRRWIGGVCRAAPGFRRRLPAGVCRGAEEGGQVRHRDRRPGSLRHARIPEGHLQAPRQGRLLRHHSRPVLPHRRPLQDRRRQGS